MVITTPSVHVPAVVAANTFPPSTTIGLVSISTLAAVDNVWVCITSKALLVIVMVGVSAADLLVTCNDLTMIVSFSPGSKRLLLSAALPFYHKIYIRLLLPLWI